MRTGILSLVFWANLIVFGFSADSYKVAYEKSQLDNQPLIISVSATWCPACILLKNDGVFSRLFKRYKVESYHYAEVDYDLELDLAKKLMVGNQIPHQKVWK